MVGDNAREIADVFCAGSSPPQNGLEERLDMIVAQLSAIAIELNKLNAVLRDDAQDKDVVAQ
jgi:hypothetical protein